MECQDEVILDYRHLLNDAFLLKLERNPSYSLRAFARDLALSSSHLSDVLKYKKELSVEKGLQIAQKLGFNSPKTELFSLLIQKSCSDDLTYNTYLDQRIKALMPGQLTTKLLDLNHFSLISKWYHFAIMELLSLSRPPQHIHTIAKRLNIEITEVEKAMEQLMLVGLVTKTDTQYLANYLSYGIGSLKSSSIRQFHKMHLQIAAEKIEQQDFNERDFSGRTLRINPKQLPKIKQEIKDFRDRIANIAAEGETNRVYHLAIQFYGLDAVIDE